MNYAIIVYDCCGEYCRIEFETFIDALAALHDIRRIYRGKVCVVCNVDRVDLDCMDGLTADERDQL